MHFKALLLLCGLLSFAAASASTAHTAPECDKSNGFQKVCCPSKNSKYCKVQSCKVRSLDAQSLDAQSRGARFNHVYCCKINVTAHGKIDGTAH
ncbi:hypothetical protein BGZ91_009080, partial [Linnemannia elongata]